MAPCLLACLKSCLLEACDAWLLAANALPNTMSKVVQVLGFLSNLLQTPSQKYSNDLDARVGTVSGDPQDCLRMSLLNAMNTNSKSVQPTDMNMKTHDDGQAHTRARSFYRAHPEIKAAIQLESLASPYLTSSSA